MLIVLLDNGRGVAHVDLQNLAIATADEKLVAIVQRGEARTIWNGRRVVIADDAPRLSVPEAEGAVIARGQEGGPIMHEGSVAHSFGMRMVRANAAQRMVDVPNVRLSVHASGEQQVAVRREEARQRHAVVVDVLLENAALGDVWGVRLELSKGARRRRRVHPCAVLVVVRG